MGRFAAKSGTTTGAAGSSTPIADPKVSGRFPALWDFVTVTACDNGDPRKTTTLLLFVEGGVWKCCIHDRERDRSAFVAASTLEGLMGKVDKGLDTDSLDWRSREGPRRGRQ